jgi:hypothetical protein
MYCLIGDTSNEFMCQRPNVIVQYISRSGSNWNLTTGVEKENATSRYIQVHGRQRGVARRRQQATGGEKDREAQREDGERKSAKRRSPPPIAAAAAAVAWGPARRGGERSATAARTGPCVDSESELDFRASDFIGGRGGHADMWPFRRTRNRFSLEELL